MMISYLMRYFLATKFVRSNTLHSTPNTVAFGQAIITHPSANGTATNSKEKHLPSHKIVKDFMEKRKSEGMKSKVVGKERDRLKSLLWPTLTPKQHAQYKTPTSPRLNSWITKTIAAVIKKVRFPEHTAKWFEKRKCGEANSFTMEAIK